MTVIREIIHQIIDFIYGNLFALEAISVFLSAAMISLAIYMNVKLNLTGEKIEHWIDVVRAETISERSSLKAWKQIQKRLKIGSPTQLKLAVLEADRILNELLKAAGYPGHNLEEKLAEMNTNQLANLEEVKQVHRIRDRIVSETDFALSREETKIALDIYKRAFIDLGFLEE